MNAILTARTARRTARTMLADGHPAALLLCWAALVYTALVYTTHWVRTAIRWVKGLDARFQAALDNRTPVYGPSLVTVGGFAVRSAEHAYTPIIRDRVYTPLATLTQTHADVSMRGAGRCWSAPVQTPSVPSKAPGIVQERTERPTPTDRPTPTRNAADAILGDSVTSEQPITSAARVTTPDATPTRTPRTRKATPKQAPTGGRMYTADHLDTMSKAELQDVARAKGVAVGGTKADIRKRLSPWVSQA